MEALEARFRAEWGPRLEEAQRKKVEDERQRSRERGRAAILAASVLVFPLFALALVLRLLPFGGTTTVLVLAVVVPAILAIYGAWALQHTSNPLPDPSDLSGRWWGTVSARGPSVRRPGPALEARGYGDQGEEALVAYLSKSLPGAYVALRGPLVARNLDADLVVVGPGRVGLRGQALERRDHLPGRRVAKDEGLQGARRAPRPGGPGHPAVRRTVGQGGERRAGGLEAGAPRAPRPPRGHRRGPRLHAPGAVVLRGRLVPGVVRQAEYLLGGHLALAEGTRLYDGGAPARPGHSPRAIRPAARAAGSGAVGDLVRRRAGPAPARGRRRAGPLLPPGSRRGRGQPVSVPPGGAMQEPRKRAIYYPHPDDPPKG